MDTNYNIAFCIQEATNFGNWTFTNICSDKVIVVPWGSLDWFGYGALWAAGILALAFLGGISAAIARDF